MKKYLFFAAALFTLAACNKDENHSEDANAPVELRLTSSLQVQTRAAHDLDTYLAAGEQVHVWVDDAGTDVQTTNLYVDNVLTVQDDKASLSDGETMYFPTTGNNVNIYAVHGNLSSTTSFWGETVTHTVASDQQSSVTEAGAGYAVSDLVYGKVTDIERTKSAVPMTLSHLLSKIEVVLVQGAGSPVIAQVEIINTQLEATFTPDKDNDFAVTAAGNITDSNPIAIDIDLTSADDAAAEDDTNKALNEAVIVPQTLTSGTKFIRVTTDEGGVLNYSLPAETEFQAGMKYRYTITANLTELTVTTVVTDWVDGGSDTGSAEMD